MVSEVYYYLSLLHTNLNIQNSAFYKEALDNAVAYNAQVMRDRRNRLPYVDAQTGIAQTDTYNWKKTSERQKGILPGTGWALFEIRLLGCEGVV